MNEIDFYKGIENEPDKHEYTCKPIFKSTLFYRPAEKKDKYARWFVTATSYHMPEGEYEYGDTYIHDILVNGRGKLIDATPEWRDAYSH